MNEPDRRLMNESDGKFWPYKPRYSIIWTILLLVGFLIILSVLHKTINWPSQDSETVVFMGAIIFSLLPIALALIDAIIERGGRIKIKDFFEADFSRASSTGITGFLLPVNIGEPDYPVNSSTVNVILNTLEQAAESDVVIIDLKDGQAWWETRLLVLLAGAVRLTKPDKLVFVGKCGSIEQSFQGWGYSRDLLKCLLNANPQYLRSYNAAQAVGRQYALLEPVNPQDREQPKKVPKIPNWMSSYEIYPFDGAGLTHQHFTEEILAADLGKIIEQPEGSERMSLPRLQELFKSVLYKDCIDEHWSTEHKMRALFDSNAAYMAITHNGAYVMLVSKVTILSTIVGTIVEKK